MNKLNSQSPLNEWLCYLENSHFKAIDLGLERIKSVAEKLDLLHPAPFVITVGGTNGKGTSCRLLETILLNAGLRVGVYSSPHLIDYRERVRIQNELLSPESHTASFDFIEKNRTESLTYFEFSTLSALYLFKQAKLDVVILEVGLGGRLDATNIVDSNIAVITSIDIDHTDFLGSSRDGIAFEKAGIFRRNCPVVIGEPNVPSTMLDYSDSLNCLMSCRDQNWTFSKDEMSWNWKTLDNTNLEYRNLPFCQIPLANAATVLATLQFLPFNISEQIIHQSLQQVELAGRFQTIKSQDLVKLAHLTDKKLPRVIIDVGHNPHAARYLSEKLAELGSQTGGEILAIFGLLKDKDAQGVIEPLLSQIDAWYCVGLDGARGQTGDALARQVEKVAQDLSQSVKVYAAENVISGIEMGLKACNEQDILLVFGSFHTVGEFLQFLQ